MIKKRDMVILGIVLLLASVLTLSSHRPGTGFWFNAANFTFGLGLMYIAIGLCVIVRNLGLFMSIAYSRYKRDFKKHGHAYHSVTPVSFGEFVLERKRDKLPTLRYLVFGVPLVAISFLFAYL
jgi:hypothetical protein